MSKQLTLSCNQLRTSLLYKLQTFLKMSIICIGISIKHSPEMLMLLIKDKSTVKMVYKQTSKSGLVTDGILQVS